MSSSPPEEDGNKASLKKNAAIYAIVIGVFTTVLVYWILDQQTSGFRVSTAIAGGVIVAIAMYRKSIKDKVNSSAKDGE